MARIRNSKEPGSVTIRNSQQQRRTVLIQIIGIFAILTVMSIVKYWR
jgi:hypothetical protein